MTLRTYLLTTVTHPAMRCIMSPGTPMLYANALAMSYHGLHLGHLDLTPMGRPH
jgi:hypothetical protein